MLVPEIEPPAVLGVTTLHVMVWLVALLGTTVPTRVSGTPAVAAVGMPEMLVTETCAGAVVLNEADALAGVTECVAVSALRCVKV